MARLSAGLGFVRQGSADLLIPQQAHYQMLGGVNFKKGCYTGQEVIARLEHLGQAKKYLYVYREAPVSPGESVELEWLPLSKSLTRPMIRKIKLPCC